MRSLQLALTAGAIVSLLAACGDDGGGSAADAGDEIDAGPDADIEPTSGPCGIVYNPLGVIAGGDIRIPVITTPISGLTVVFTGPDGTLIGTATTDDKGAASRTDCGRDTIITVLTTPADFAGITIVGGTQGVTFTNVQPNDTVYYGGARTPEPPYVPRSINVTIPASVSVPGATNVALVASLSNVPFDDLGCATGYSLSDTAVTVPFFIDDRCVQADGTIDLWAVVLDQNASTLASTGVNDITPDVAGTTTVNLPDWTLGSTDSSFVVANPPPDTGDFFGFGGQILGKVPHGVNFDSNYILGDGCIRGPIPLAVSAAHWSPPPGFGTSSVIRALATRGLSNGLRLASTLVTQVEDQTDSTFFDMGADGLPYILGAIITEPTPGRPQLNWLTAAPLTEGTMSIIELDIAISGTDKVDYQNSRWIIISPRATEGFIQAPPLPAEFIGGLFPANASVDPDVVGLKIEHYSTRSYRDVVTTPGYFPYRPELEGVPDVSENHTYKQTSAGSFAERLAPCLD